jgi:hypothetical protein
MWHGLKQHGKFRVVYFAVAALSYIANIILFFQAQWYIGRIKARDRRILIWLGALKPRKPKKSSETPEQSE